MLPVVSEEFELVCIFFAIFFFLLSLSIRKRSTLTKIWEGSSRFLWAWIDIYLGRKQTPEFNLGLGKDVVLQLMKDLERLFCTVYFDNFFNSPKLIEKLFQKCIYGTGTVRANREQMQKMIDDKQMKRGDCKFLFSGNTMACKWMNNRSVLLLSSALEGMNNTLLVQRTEKGSKTKCSVPCPKIVMLYNSGMGGVDLMYCRLSSGLKVICYILPPHFL